MRKKEKLLLKIGLVLILLFVLWTLAVSFIDIAPIGPLGTAVGFSTLNGQVHNFFGTNLSLYFITDILEILPFGFAILFALLGLIQWWKRKSILAVDFDIIALGVFYAIVIAAFLLFEVLIINYRPVLLDGALEASYPSSTTLLTSCVMTSAIMVINARTKSRKARITVSVLISLFTAFMIIARLISGVHWFTDIIGSIILSAGLVTVYYSAILLKKRHSQPE